MHFVTTISNDALKCVLKATEAILHLTRYLIIGYGLLAAKMVVYGR
jgi:hypothetical protein